MTDPAFPRGLTADVQQDWTALGARGTATGAVAAPAFAALPEPVRRWLTFAVPEGTPLASSVELRMRGEIRLGRWAPYTAVQRLGVTDGFVWAATARPMGLPVVGFDRWTRDTGEMRWRLFGALPVMSASGPDVSRSAAGRHAGELLLAIPMAALHPSVDWRAIDSDHAVATVRTGPSTHEVTVTIRPDGALQELVMMRWGAIGKGPFGEQVFGATVHGNLTVDGVTVPQRVTAGWHYGTDRWPEGQFIRYTVEEVRYR